MERRGEKQERGSPQCAQGGHTDRPHHTPTHHPALNSVPQYSINIFAFSLIAAPLRIYEDFVLNGKLG